MVTSWIRGNKHLPGHSSVVKGSTVQAGGPEFRYPPPQHVKAECGSAHLHPQCGSWGVGIVGSRDKVDPLSLAHWPAHELQVLWEMRDHVYKNKGGEQPLSVPTPPHTYTSDHKHAHVHIYSSNNIACTTVTHITYQQSAHPYTWNLPPKPPILQAMRTVMKNELAAGHGWAGGLHLISFITVLLMVWCLGKGQGETLRKAWERSTEVGNSSWDPRNWLVPFRLFMSGFSSLAEQGKRGCLKHLFFKNRLTWEKTLQWNNLMNPKSGACFGPTRGFEGS